MLAYIDRVCSENNIEYSLFGGAMLGAVRDNGYIPWDDDVDIVLEYQNFEKLISTADRPNFLSNRTFSSCLPWKSPIVISLCIFLFSYTYSHSKHQDNNS